MPDKFIFHGQTTFIDKPHETVIQNFQNNYIIGDGSDRDKINTELIKLVKLILSSKVMPNETKEETIQAIKLAAEQIKTQKVNKLTLKGTLQEIQEVVSEVTDIAAPALGIITDVLKILGFA